MEASRGVWPACPNRFIVSNTRSTKLDLAGEGSSAEVTLEESNTNDGAFYLKLNGKYMSYDSKCSNTMVDTNQHGGSNQEFRLTPTTNGTYGFEWNLQAVGRNCTNKAVSFSKDCNSNALSMGPSSGYSIFHMHAVRNNGDKYDKPANSASGCADPFAWYCAGAKAFQLACTGDKLALFHSGTMSKDARFKQEGSVLGGSIPRWASSGNRWAPENLEVEPGKLQVVFFSDSSPDTHRVGWAMSQKSGSSLSGSWDLYSKKALDLGNSAGGEIDQHIFRDSDGRTYLLWKTDDNNVGAKTTRLWGQEVAVTTGKVDLVGQRKMLMDSSGLLWVTSWVSGGSLVEGPELIHHGEY
jgi:hypothetical protein